MKTKKHAMAFFGVVTLFSMACSFAHPVTPALFKQLQLEDYMFGVALACMSFGNLLLSPFWGKIAGYLSSRCTLLICTVGYAVGQLLFAMCKTVPQVVLVRFFTGLFVGGCFVGMLTYIVNTAPDERTRGRYLAIQATLEGVFNAVGYFVGGMLGEISVQLAVIVQAVTLAACGILFAILCESDAREHEKLRVGGLLRDANPFGAFIQGRALMCCLIGVLFVVCTLQNFSYTCFDQSFNYYAIDQIGLSTGYNGAIKGVMGIVTLIANGTVCVWLLQKTDTRKSVVAVLAVCGLTMTCALMITSLVPFLIVNVLFYALSVISVPLLQNLVAAEGKAQGHDSNLVMGFYNAMRSLGGILGALLAGFTYMVTPKTPFICCVAGFLLAAVFSAFYALRSAKKA